MISIELKTEKSSWPSKVKPPSYLTRSSSFDFDIHQMLLLLGLITTPPQSSIVTLSMLWAQLRYLYAVDRTKSELRLKKQFGELDPHQKTILSDDFGMGISTLFWLNNAGIASVVDGHYFQKNTALSIGKRFGINKVGNSKTPDFIGRDYSGRWHILECKGTQTSIPAQNTQIKKGKTQKSSIKFPKSIRGETLVGSVLIAQSNSNFQSNLTFADPLSDPVLDLTHDQMGHAQTVFAKGAISKALALFGLPNFATLLSISHLQEELELTEEQKAENRLIKERASQEIQQLSSEKVDFHENFFNFVTTNIQTSADPEPKEIQVRAKLSRHFLNALNDHVNSPSNNLPEEMMNPDYIRTEIRGSTNVSPQQEKESIHTLSVGNFFYLDLIIS